jgi:hypothetical protein
MIAEKRKLFFSFLFFFSLTAAPGNLFCTSFKLHPGAPGQSFDRRGSLGTHTT